MTDPVTTIMLLVSRYIEKARLQFGLTDSDIRLLVLAIGAYTLCIVLFSVLAGRKRKRKVPMSVAERENLRNVRQQRMPGKLR